MHDEERASEVSWRRLEKLPSNMLQKLNGSVSAPVKCISAS